jgi:hypothetical protein
MPPIPKAPKPSVVAALGMNGPGAPMPPIPKGPKPSDSTTLALRA